MKEKILLCLVFAAATAITAMLSWEATYQAALERLRIDANRKLEQATDQFTGQLSAARILPTLLARNNEIVNSLEQETINDVVVEYLERARDLSSAHEIRLLNNAGDELFSTSTPNSNKSEADTTYFSKAMQSALGVAVRYHKENDIRTITFARSILSADYTQLGVVVLDMGAEILESEFRARPEVLIFLDSSGVVVFSNRTQLLFKKLKPFHSDLDSRQHANLSLVEHIIEQPIVETQYNSITVWKNFPAVTSNSTRLVARRKILPISLEAILLVDTEPALRQARKITSLSVALLILAIVSGIAIFQRRRRFIEKIETEQALIKELDRRVALRSKELERAQNELVQSAKLSALGKMSAGISHELNQPIASIQSFAVNAKRFLERNRVDESIQNLSEIEAQTERMSRIIRNLRNFSRKDELPRELVDICKVLNQVNKMLEPRLKTEGVVLTIANQEQPIMVMGGEIRLQQVLINLISNAIEALSDQDNKQIGINIDQVDQLLEITIRDNGPGLADPTRIFEPFYTTKTGSHDDGLGLGLSIAYGFVESFGGTLRATNCDDGGALFTLNLAAIPQDDLHS